MFSVCDAGSFPGLGGAWRVGGVVGGRVVAQDKPGLSILFGAG